MLIYQPYPPTMQAPEEYEARWNGPDQGLVCCWLRGIEKAKDDPGLAAKARAGELPILAWKGGVDKETKNRKKVGAMYYLATWQGLREEPLDIDLTAQPQLTCTRTGVTVTFTSSIALLGGADE